jgi:hypothetical protein
VPVRDGVVNARGSSERRGGSQPAAISRVFLKALHSSPSSLGMSIHGSGDAPGAETRGTEIRALPLTPTSLSTLPLGLTFLPVHFGVPFDHPPLPCVLFGNEFETHITRPTPQQRRGAFSILVDVAVPQLLPHLLLDNLS